MIQVTGRGIFLWISIHNLYSYTVYKDYQSIDKNTIKRFTNNIGRADEKTQI